MKNCSGQTEKARYLIEELCSLYRIEKAVDSLVELGAPAVEVLQAFLMEGKPSKIFQPRLHAVEALARLGAKEVLIAYLLQEREIDDPEDRFGEEAVKSSAARFLSTWPGEEMYRLLLNLSERRMLIGLIDALAEYMRADSMQYFERAIEDDFYRPAAEDAFMKLGGIACDALSVSAARVAFSPHSTLESPSSLGRRRSAVRILKRIGISAEHWRRLRALIRDPDDEIAAGIAGLGTEFASKEDRDLMASRLIELVSRVSWYLQEGVEDTLVALQDEAAELIAAEISSRMKQPEDIRSVDLRLRALLRIANRYERT